MARKENDIFADDLPEETYSEVFAKQPGPNPGTREVFAGDDDFHRRLTGGIKLRSPFTALDTPSVSRRPHISWVQVFMVINLMAVTALLGYILLRPPAVNIAAADISRFPAAPVAASNTPPEPGTTPKPAAGKPAQADIETVNRTAASWNTAEKLFEKQNYQNAFAVYEQLNDNLEANTPRNELLRDYLQFKMALCKTGTDDQSDVSSLFTAALQSRSPLVRGLANYRLGLLENEHGHYLNARARAYQTIALINAFDEVIPASMEGDCYFTLAEALTRQVLELNNAPDELPGRLWSDSMPIVDIPPMSQDDLIDLLQTGIDRLNAHAMRPDIERKPSTAAGNRASAISMDAPLSEVLNRFASTMQMSLVWTDPADMARADSTSLYLPDHSEQFIAEAAAGSAGLIAHLDGASITVYNPRTYDNLDSHKDLLAREAIAVWRRFLIRYRGDHRSANAHFALGLLNHCSGEDSAALGEYKLMASTYPSNPLAPFALLNSSLIKTDLQDYDGARRDLNEIFVQYPDCKLMGKALCYHARTAMKSGLYDQALKSFSRAYNLDIDRMSRRDSAYGMGKCYFSMKMFTEARRWLITAIGLTEGKPDETLADAYFMLGKTCIELGQFAEASAALTSAIRSASSKKQYVDVILQLAVAEIGREEYVSALNILENLPIERLSQTDTCRTLLAKTEVWRQLDMVDSAITLLRQKKEFIAEAALRAQLTLELAKCYRDRSDYLVAKKEVMKAMADLPPGKDLCDAYLLMAEVSIKLDDARTAEQTCLRLLAAEPKDESVRRDAFKLLGKAYSDLQLHEKAALAYAGLTDNTGINLK
jgi:tetratricopeptide (TPR) repeat protein